MAHASTSMFVLQTHYHQKRALSETFVDQEQRSDRGAAFNRAASTCCNTRVRSNALSTPCMCR
jgi:hypothetical protein